MVWAYCARRICERAFTRFRRGRRPHVGFFSPSTGHHGQCTAEPLITRKIIPNKEFLNITDSGSYAVGFWRQFLSGLRLLYKPTCDPSPPSCNVRPFEAT